MVNYVQFNEKDHRYTTRITGEPYISATQLLDLFKHPYNREYWSYYKGVQLFCTLNNLDHIWQQCKKDWKSLPETEKAIQHYVRQQFPAYVPHIDISHQTIIDQWLADNLVSTTDGTNYHRYREQQSYRQGYELYVAERPELLTAVHTQTHYTFNLNELPDGYHSELLVYSHAHKVSGQIDKCWITTQYIDPLVEENQQWIELEYGNVARVLWTADNRPCIRWVDLDDFKGLSLNTPIATKTGWKTMGDIVVGDEIFDGNGKITSVEHVSQIHYNPCYKIIFDTNEELICDHEHRWVVSTRKKKGALAISYNVDHEMTTDELYVYQSTKFRLKIKCVSLKLDEIDLPIDPYVLGVWLGGGNRSVNTITNVDAPVWAEIQRRGYIISHCLTCEGSSVRAETRTIYGIQGKLNELNLINNKHLPDLYARASYQQRLDLLRGFMDIDGHYHRKRNRCVMRTTQQWQIDALVQLTTSLGYKPTIIPLRRSGFGKINIAMWDICFTPTENPFLVQNTDYLTTVRTPEKYSGYRYIKSIEKIDTVPTKCLAVTSPDHTYLAGYGLIKTHNTNKKMKPAFKGQTMKYPLQHILQEHKGYYPLQVSLYGFLLETWGYTVRRTAFTHCDPILDSKKNRQYDPVTGVLLVKEIPYPFTYRRNDVINMLNVYRQQLDSQVV